LAACKQIVDLTVALQLLRNRFNQGTEISVLESGKFVLDSCLCRMHNSLFLTNNEICNRYCWYDITRCLLFLLLLLYIVVLTTNYFETLFWTKSTIIVIRVASPKSTETSEWLLYFLSKQQSSQLWLRNGSHIERKTISNINQEVEKWTRRISNKNGQVCDATSNIKGCPSHGRECEEE